MRIMKKYGIAVSAIALVAIATTGCGANSGDGPAASADPTAAVTITVGDKPSADKPADLEAWEVKVEEFEELYPNVTIEGSEIKYDPQSFGAMVAGDTLPSVLRIPMSDIQGLIQRKQAADVTEALNATGVMDELNPAVLESVTGPDGGIFGLPIQVYGIGLVYNRAVFEQAGLDPNSPPETWEEVREAARTIAENTDAAGLALMTTDGYGGSTVTASTYSFGGTITSEDGYQATLATDPGAADFLELIQQMRWEDDSMGETFLYNRDSISQDFVAGRVGMFIDSPNGYKANVVNYGMDPEVFGMGAMPQANGAEASMTGGTMVLFNTALSPNEKLAAVNWINFFQFGKLTDEKVAVEDARVQQEAGTMTASGVPGLSPISPEASRQYLEWVTPYTGVILENFAPYTDTLEDLTFVQGPAVNSAAVYGVLDTVLQGVLTNESADVATLLSDAAGQIDGLVSR